MTDEQQQRLVVESDGERLDAFLASRIESLSRSRAVQLIADGHVTVNERIPKKSEKVSAGDVVLVTLPAAEPSAVTPEDIPLNIIFQDEDLIVLDKPAGLVVHPAVGHARGTLVNALLHHIKDLSGIGGVMRPGIVHRLDRDTSGLMIVAKNDEAHRGLSAALKKRDIRRRYLVAAWGHLGSDTAEVDAPIGRSPHDRKKMAVVATGRAALTRFERLEKWKGADLLKAELQSGRTHQIRVHLLSIGHPVVGDELYSPAGERGISGPSQKWAWELARRTPRQFLHAAELAFRHPRSREVMRFSSELPPDLAGAAEWARTH